MSTDKEKTLHSRILGDIEQRILSGEWQPGFRLPYEVDLAVQYGCSRMTANKVLTQLARAGLIERRKKSGSFVAQPLAQSAVLEIQDIETEVRSLHLPYRYHIEAKTRRNATLSDRAKLELRDGGPVLDIAVVHFAGERPFCLERRLINLTTVPEAETEAFAMLSPGAWLISRIPWNAAEHRIQAVSASTDVAAKLDIVRGTACLVIERRTWGPEGPVTFVRFSYPGERHALVARFQPGG